MELTIAAMTGEKQGKYGPFFSVKDQEGKWWIVNHAVTSQYHKGATLVGHPLKKGNFDVFNVATVVDPAEPPSATPRDQVAALDDRLARAAFAAAKPIDIHDVPRRTKETPSWLAFQMLINAAADTAAQVFPDTESFDRSDARVALMQTILLAERQGQFRYFDVDAPDDF
jgi:hypothetical protein